MLYLSGKSKINRDFLVCAKHFITNKGVLKIISSDGEEKVVKTFDYGICCFRQFEDNNNFYYSYLCQYAEKTAGLWGVRNSTLTITDDHLNVIKEDIKLLPYGSINEESYCNNHGYIIKSLDHYYLFGTIPTLVSNLPGAKEPIYIANDIIQEQLNGQVIWQFETTDYPELCSLSLFRNDYENARYRNIACDCLHINSAVFTSDNKFAYISYKNLGVIKIEKATKKIVAIFAHKLDSKLFMGQHDIRLLDDNTFMVFNNNGVGRKPSDRDLNKPSQICICKLAKDNTIDNYTAIDTPEPSAAMLGSCELLDAEEQIYDIVYSPFATTLQFQEWSPLTKQVYCSIKISLLDPYYMYSMERSIKNYEE